MMAALSFSWCHPCGAFTPSTKNLNCHISRSQEQQRLHVIRNVLEDSSHLKTTKAKATTTNDSLFSEEETIITSWEATNDVASVSTSCSLDSVDGRRTNENDKKNNNKYTLFANLPVEADQELTIDQRIIGAILKEPMIEVVDTLMVLLSSFLVAVSTLNSIDLTTLAQIIRTENFIGCIFAVEFFVRWYSSFRWKGVLQYLTQPLVLVDLLVVILPLVPLMIPNTADGVYSILPSWLVSSAGLINLRLLRVLRLQRVLTDIDTFSDFQLALGIPQSELKPYKLQLARVLLSAFTLLSISSGLIYSTEHSVNPDIPDYFTAMYFGLTTITTVGFGDITPVTWEGKLVVSASILAGVAIIPTQAAALVEAFLERDQMKLQTENESSSSSSFIPPSLLPSDENEIQGSSRMIKTKCTNCGASYHWEEAQFCYSCGNEFSEKKLKDVDIYNM